MNITVICRTRNEEANIERFCKSYMWADKIIIADGGSTDKTVQLASQYSNVSIKFFLEQVRKDNMSVWRNPHGRHINFMIKEAEASGADWIIFDDADCFPTTFLQEGARTRFRTIDEAGYEFATVNRIYTFEDWAYFENLTKPNGNMWEANTSLYAWKANMGFYADEADPWEHAFNQPIPNESFKFSPPLAVIHDYYPSTLTRRDKVQFYRESGEQLGCQDPIYYGGDLIPMEPWMKYE